VAHRVVSLRCNDSSAIGDKADSGSQSDRRIYELTAYRVIADIEQAAQISSICGYAPWSSGASLPAMARSQRVARTRAR
jgi:hypothetical protein